MKQKPGKVEKLFFKPAVGSTFSILAGLSFFLLCMILPLVGQAGSWTEHAAENAAVFAGLLLLTLLLASLAVASKFGRRRADGSPKPWLSISLATVCILMLIVLLFGGFKI